MEVLRGNLRVELPPSRKTRALLAYLATTRRAQRRERLCSMFWEIPDDPRGALRWSLSRLRGVIDEPGVARIIANRETVSFDAIGMDIDVVFVRELTSAGLDGVSTASLADAVGRFHGE